VVRIYTDAGIVDKFSKNGAAPCSCEQDGLKLYSTHLSAEFHLHALQEMLRVSREVRVFPLLTLDGASSPHLHFVSEHLASDGFGVEVKRVPYKFQRGGNVMLVIKHV
jgi:hypothetical protein